jgi:uncharacterized OB-fold protein
VALSAALDFPGSASRPRFDKAAGQLVGSRCGGCGAVSWPSRAVCYRCGKPLMIECAFEPTGSLLTYTTVWVARPGIEPPYTLGQVKLDYGPLVFGHVRGLAADAQVPVPVRLAVAIEEGAFPPFWFEPEEDR